MCLHSLDPFIMSPYNSNKFPNRTGSSKGRTVICTLPRTVTAVILWIYKFISIYISFLERRWTNWTAACVRKSKPAARDNKINRNLMFEWATVVGKGISQRSADDQLVLISWLSLIKPRSCFSEAHNYLFCFTQTLPSVTGLVFRHLMCFPNKSTRNL